MLTREQLIRNLEPPRGRVDVILDIVGGEDHVPRPANDFNECFQHTITS